MRNRLDITPYQAKIQELRGLVEKEAKNLQNVLEGKDNALKECRELGERKERLNRELGTIEHNISEANNNLEQLCVRKERFITSAKTELVNLRKEIGATKKELSKLVAHVKETSNVYAELERFLQHERDAREKFLAIQEKLSTAEQKHDLLITKTKKEKEEIEQKQKELDAFKQHTEQLYGKLASYVAVAQQTVEYVNESLKNNVPLHFRVPEGEIIELTLDNFNE